MLEHGHATSGFVLFRICAIVVFGLGVTCPRNFMPFITGRMLFVFIIRLWKGKCALHAFVAMDAHRVDSRVPFDGEELACCDRVVRGNAFRLVTDLGQLV